MLGELVQTTAGKWITHPPMRCPNGTPSAPAPYWSATRLAPVTAAGTPRDLPHMRPDGVRAAVAVVCGECNRRRGVARGMAPTRAASRPGPGKV
jgi:hypothetical protein